MRENKESLLEDISSHLPVMQRAEKLQERAAAVGFDWADTTDILDKIREEVDEVHEAVSHRDAAEKIAGEIGDLLFVCINLARRLQIDAETALGQANAKFIRRFQYIEQHIDKPLEEASLDEMDALWDEAKTGE